MFLGLFLRNGNDGYIQAMADGLSDVFERHTLFGHSVISSAGLMLFQRQPVEASDIKPVRGRPAVVSVANVCRDALLSGYRDQVGDKALLDRIVNLRKPDD